MTNTAQQKDVRAHFGRVSSAWANRYTGTPQRMSELDLQLRQRVTLALLEPMGVAGRGRALLDIGCGGGNLLAALAGHSFALHGVDLVPEMVTQARQRAPGADVRRAEAAELPWPDEHMDVVTSLGVLEYLPQPQAALAEMHRVLKPGGWLIASFPNRESLFRRVSRWEIALEESLAGALRAARGRPGGARKPAYAHYDRSVPVAGRLLSEAGFEVDAVRCNTYGLWGRLGRTGAALRLSQRLSARFSTPAGLARYLACTLVFRARKPQRGGAAS